jgi:hypothetical protein
MVRFGGGFANLANAGRLDSFDSLDFSNRHSSAYPLIWLANLDILALHRKRLLTPARKSRCAKSMDGVAGDRVLAGKKEAKIAIQIPLFDDFERSLQRLASTI